MKKFLNFSTILFSYLLITVLVISCGGSSGGGGGTGGSSVGDATNGNGGNGGDATDNTDGSDGNGGEPTDATNGNGDNGGEPTDATNGNGDNGGDATDSTDGSGGNGGDPNDATDSTDGGNPPQVELNDACFLENRQGEATLVAVLCYEGELFATITKDTTEIQQLNLLIDSVDNPGGTPSRTWDLSTARQIHISYDKDYTLTVDVNTAGDIGTIAETTDHTAEFPLQNLTIASLLNDSKDALRSGVISFSQPSGSFIQVDITPKLAVKTQADFISMTNVSIPDLTSEDYRVPFVLVNDLNLVAPDGEAAKFDNSVIPVAETAFLFDGGGKTINLNSEIDAVANDKPAAIIGEIKRAVTLQNFTFNVNKPISGTGYVGTIIAHASSGGLIDNIKININGSLSLYKSNASNTSYVGGVVGSGCFDINNVVVKTVAGAVIQSSIAEVAADITRVNFNISGLASHISCSAGAVTIKNNLVDVTLEAFTSGDIPSSSFEKNLHRFGGLANSIAGVSEINSNLIKVVFSRGNLPIDFNIASAGGLILSSNRLSEISKNLVYADFSNLGRVKYIGGLFTSISSVSPKNNITNNMLFIADGFTGDAVQASFGAAIQHYSNSEVTVSLNITNSFFSTPVNYSIINMATFVHGVVGGINFDYLILDDTTDTLMFKIGSSSDTARGKVANANLSTLAEGANSPVAASLKASDSWDAGIGGYPQLKTPSDLTGSVTKNEIEIYWTSTNDLIQKGLTDRANQ